MTRGSMRNLLPHKVYLQAYPQNQISQVIELGTWQEKKGRSKEFY